MSFSSPISVFVIDDHTLFRRGLIALIAQDAGLRVVGEAGDAGEALRLVPALAPQDILLAEAREQQALLGSANQAEAVRAGLEKRAPVFSDQGL